MKLFITFRVSQTEDHLGRENEGEPLWLQVDWRILEDGSYNRNAAELFAASGAVQSGKLYATVQVGNSKEAHEAHQGASVLYWQLGGVADANLEGFWNLPPFPPQAEEEGGRHE